jgi:hypothetical protein
MHRYLRPAVLPAAAAGVLSIAAPGQASGRSSSSLYTAALDQFDELIRKAYGIPFTDQVRLDRGEVYVLLDRLRTAVNHPPVDVAGLLDELDELVQRAKPIPLTNQIRIDREEIYDLLDRIRTTPLRRADEDLTR